ncbi:MAG: competence/damage-inducible protein A [Clostridiales bacterium]|nr:competence/damage-inducible protein A [Clostridiales bacterium]
MNAEIIAVGTEILLGDITNTDAKFLSEELAALGISVYYQTVVGDNKDRLMSALKDGFNRSDIIITTGGLGPTDDDITKETGAEFFKRCLKLDNDIYDDIKAYFKGRDMAKTNIKQAYVPEGAIALRNNNGTAPGIIIEENGKVLIMLPGPPNELKPMFNESVKPFLAGREKHTIISRTIRLTGIGESTAAEMVRDLMAKSVNPTIAPYAKEDGVFLRITAKGETREECERLIEPAAKEIYMVLGEFVYGENETSLARAVVQSLIDRKITLAVAESLTGGMLSSAIVDIEGVSRIFKEGFVTYTNESKMETAGVKETTIRHYGAVSRETAAEMAQGAALRAGAELGLSTTGIAGGGAVANPTETDTSYDKPVGRVYLGIYYKGKTYTKELNIKGNRQKVRRKTVAEMLDFVRKTVV